MFWIQINAKYQFEVKIKDKIVIFSIDNLTKGASGQAIQNMNLLYKYSENLGLKWKIFVY